MWKKYCFELKTVLMSARKMGLLKMLQDFQKTELDRGVGGAGGLIP